MQDTSTTKVDLLGLTKISVRSMNKASMFVIAVQGLLTVILIAASDVCHNYPYYYLVNGLFLLVVGFCATLIRHHLDRDSEVARGCLPIMSVIMIVMTCMLLFEVVFVQVKELSSNAGTKSNDVPLREKYSTTTVNQQKNQ